MLPAKSRMTRFHWFFPIKPRRNSSPLWPTWQIRIIWATPYWIVSQIIRPKIFIVSGLSNGKKFVKYTSQDCISTHLTNLFISKNIWLTVIRAVKKWAKHPEFDMHYAPEKPWAIKNWWKWNLFHVKNNGCFKFPDCIYFKYSIQF